MFKGGVLYQIPREIRIIGFREILLSQLPSASATEHLDIDLGKLSAFVLFMGNLCLLVDLVNLQKAICAIEDSRYEGSQLQV